MARKKGLIYHKKKGLTKVEKEVLNLITEKFLTIKQIAKQRDCSLNAVYKVIKRLKKKGAYNIILKKVEKVEPTYSQKDIRLHGQEMNLRILWQNNKYQELLEKSNVMFLDSNTIRLYKNSIEIYSGQSFYGKNASESEKKSLEYLNKFITYLEHYLKISLIKPLARNMKVVNQHYARGDSELCSNAIKKRERMWIYAKEDGKLCFITDNSFGFKEDETVHPITSKPDRKAIDKQINDWRLNNPPTNSELSNSVNKIVNDFLPIIPELKKQIESHLALIKEYRKENIIWRKSKIKEIKKELKYGKQTKLGDFYE